MELEVHRDDARGRYYAVIDGHEAHILFAPAGLGTLDFQHTEVPRELRGHGVAEMLVRRALEDVRARGERIVPTCPFVKAFLAKHPEYQPLVATTA
jgi:predicted GNAT family acetyltransferase